MVPLRPIEILPAGQIAAAGLDTPEFPPFPPASLLAPLHLAGLFRGLLLPGERWEVREVDYGRIVELRLTVPDAENGRRWAALRLSMEAIMSARDLRTLFMDAMEQCRMCLSRRGETIFGGPHAWMGNRRRPESPSVPPDTAPILLEFAKAGKREDFEWLARSTGVKSEQLEELWRGTLARLSGGQR